MYLGSIRSLLATDWLTELFELPRYVPNEVEFLQNEVKVCTNETCHNTTSMILLILQDRYLSGCMESFQMSQ